MEQAPSLQAAERFLARSPCDLILLDLKLPNGDGLAPAGTPRLGASGSGPCGTGAHEPAEVCYSQRESDEYDPDGHP